ncbi:MAG: VOC family protein [bacterium]|nr:VOC family protein [bacterium]
MSNRSMDLIHIGLVASSEDNANRFFGDLLGLEMTRRSELPRVLAKRLFGVEDGCEILYFEDPSVVFEIFVTGWAEQAPNKISHTCIEVEQRSDLLARATGMGFEVIEAPRGEDNIYFLTDGDGNLFEVKGQH